MKKNQTINSQIEKATKAIEAWGKAVLENLKRDRLEADCLRFNRKYRSIDERTNLQLIRKIK